MNLRDEMRASSGLDLTKSLTNFGQWMRRVFHGHVSIPFLVIIQQIKDIRHGAL